MRITRPAVALLLIAGSAGACSHLPNPLLSAGATPDLRSVVVTHSHCEVGLTEGPAECQHWTIRGSGEVTWQVSTEVQDGSWEARIIGTGRVSEDRVMALLREFERARFWSFETGASLCASTAGTVVTTCIEGVRGVEEACLEYGPECLNSDEQAIGELGRAIESLVAETFEGSDTPTPPGN